MSDDNLLECCQAILEFIEEGPTHKIPTPKQLAMEEVFTKKAQAWRTSNTTNMVGFTYYLNDLFQLGYNISDENGSAKTFFKNHSVEFYKSIIRNLKIKQLLK